MTTNIDTLLDKEVSIESALEEKTFTVFGERDVVDVRFLDICCLC